MQSKGNSVRAKEIVNEFWGKNPNDEWTLQAPT